VIGHFNRSDGEIEIPTGQEMPSQLHRLHSYFNTRSGSSLSPERSDSRSGIHHVNRMNRHEGSIHAS
jgi:hypothetical protein